MKTPFDFSLYLVTDKNLTNGRPLETVVEEAIEGGVTIVQIRDKKSSTKEFLSIAKNIRVITEKAGVPLIINDRADIALAVNADGLHIGQSDMPYEEARKLMGPNAIIGISATNIEQAKAAASWDVDYLGIGPIFFTNTKEDLKTPIGFEGFKSIAAVSSHPLIAIGGIKANHVQQAMQSGAAGVAVVTAIVSADSPKLAAEELLSEVKTGRMQRPLFT